MRRNYGSPGRIDLSIVHAAAEPPRLTALTGFIAVAVILLGVAAMGLYLFELGAHLTLAMIASGRGS